ncbi:FxLYD domain-containing protein [Acaryochloris sp. IP29b_bin.137]|uniref:FxLYD domain-containing protein n=1 Tax=Acaryochloris sp. IP29b_bin.137 TaxID=2969217 RepID=UPI002615788F|nr:FxLYD domain-containing protein [Acaryochloris sp. IP29b_bin.137]
MLTSSRRWLTRLLVGSVVTSTALVATFPGHTQSAGDVIQIGGSASEQVRFRNYWQELMNLNGPAESDTDATAESSGSSFEESDVDPQALAQKLSKNLKVSNLRLVPIIRLNGSSEVQGTLKNGNKESVTVTGVNFEVLDGSGDLVQTGSAVPSPSTLSPGQSVTFKAELLTVPAGGNYKVRLTKPAFNIQGGV